MIPLCSVIFFDCFLANVLKKNTISEDSLFGVHDTRKDV